MYVCMGVCVRMYVYVCVCIHVCIYVCVRMYVCMYVCMCVCMYIIILVYIACHNDAIFACSEDIRTFSLYSTAIKTIARKCYPLTILKYILFGEVPQYGTTTAIMHVQVCFLFNTEGRFMGMK